MFNGFISILEKGKINSNITSKYQDKKEEINREKNMHSRKNSDFSFNSAERIKKWIENNYKIISTKEGYSDQSHFKHESLYNFRGDSNNFENKKRIYINRNKFFSKIRSKFKEGFSLSPGNSKDLFYQNQPNLSNGKWMRIPLKYKYISGNFK